MRKKGFKHSSETRKKIGLAQNKQINLVCLYCGNKFRRKKSIVKRGWGKFCSKDCYIKSMVGRIPWNKGKEFLHSGSFKKGNKSRLGIKNSEETRKKLSQKLKGRIITWGNKISENRKGKCLLDKNPAWRGGRSFEPYTLDWTDTLKRSIRERDNYICQMCSQFGNLVHHIDENKKNCNPNNLITLCRKCHSKLHNQKRI